jgi:glyoxylase-like metal-dependent hydrolase (beta-lactamase superfamily II)
MSAIACAGVLGTVEPVSTQGARADMLSWLPAVSAPAPGQVHAIPVQGNVHMIVGAGANITVQAGRDGILMVDTGTAAMSEQVWAVVRTISERPLRYVVNTTEHADHAGGNAIIAAKGEIIPWREAGYTAGPQGFLATTPKASVISYLTTFHRMAGPTGSQPALPEEGWPDNTYSTSQKRLYFNDEPVVIMHQPANTDGNSLVLFRKSDVVSAGDLLDLVGYPLIDLEAGGSVQSIVQGLNNLIGVTVPESNASGGTLVVPGHGRIADHAEVTYYRDMITIVRDRVQDLIDKGMTLDQVKAARPTREYDTRYGRTTGAWTTEDFVEAVYQSLRSGS